MSKEGAVQDLQSLGLSGMLAKGLQMRPCDHGSNHGWRRRGRKDAVFGNTPRLENLERVQHELNVLLIHFPSELLRPGIHRET